MAVIGDLVVRYGATTKGFDRGTRKVRGGLAAITRSAKRMIGTLAPFAGGAMFVQMLRSAEDFNQKMRQSLAIMGDVTRSMQKEMSAAAFKVARDTRFSAAQAAESYFFLASAGLSAEQSLAALPAVAAFAQAGNFDMAKATDLLTDAQSALGLTVDDSTQNLLNMVHVSDVLVKANTLANASVEQFSEALTNKAAAALRIVGKEIEEGAAVLSAFADQGLKGAEAGTALNIVFRDLQTKALLNKRAFEAAGIAVFDAAGEMNNMADIIGDLERRLDGMSDAQKKVTLMQLGFADKSVIFIQTLIGTSEKIREYERELRKAGGTTKEVADKQLTTMQKAMAKLGSEATKLGVIFNEQVTPAVAVFLQGVTGLLKILGPLVPVILLLVTAILGYALALKAAAAAQVFLTSLSGPAGWALIAAGVVIATVAIHTMNKELEQVVSQAEKAANSVGKVAEVGGKIGGGGLRKLSPVEQTLRLQEGGLVNIEAMQVASGAVGELAAEVVFATTRIAQLDKQFEATTKASQKAFETGGFFSRDSFLHSQEGSAFYRKMQLQLAEIAFLQEDLAVATEDLFPTIEAATVEFGSWEKAVSVANSAIKSILTPAEKFAAVEQRINTLLELGLITLEQQDKLLKQSKKDLFGKPSSEGAANMIKNMTDNLRLLRGEITESELAFERLGATVMEISRIKFLDREIAREQKRQAELAKAARFDEKAGRGFRGGRGGIRPREQPDIRPAGTSAGAAVERGSLGAFSAIMDTLKSDPKNRQKEIAKNTKNQNIKQDRTNDLLEKRQQIVMMEVGP